MNEIREKVEILLSTILEQHEAFLVDLSIRSERGGKLLQVFVDTDKGITIESCTQISRELGNGLERDGIIQGAYRLEVSSPGIDKPLRMLRQYKKNVGRRFKVIHQAPDTQLMLVGTLEAVEEEGLTFQTDDGRTVTLDFSKIIESKEELPW
ncbi:MAG: ribosome maturation factor RimP [Ignavibacteria bacterium]|nr:ribosome maturation factor RimP [Ignavibacteria bacterium]